MKFCIDCRFFADEKTRKDAGRDICLHPANKHQEFVFGTWVDYEASWLRNLPHLCGPEGKWFEGPLK